MVAAFNQQHRDLHTSTGRAGYVQVRCAVTPRSVTAAVAPFHAKSPLQLLLDHT